MRAGSLPFTHTRNAPGGHSDSHLCPNAWGISCLPPKQFLLVGTKQPDGKIKQANKKCLEARGSGSSHKLLQSWGPAVRSCSEDNGWDTKWGLPSWCGQGWGLVAVNTGHSHIISCCLQGPGEGHWTGRLRTSSRPKATLTTIPGLFSWYIKPFFLPWG